MVKMLTGGDRLKARFMSQDYFEFQPTDTLILSTNYKPRITGRDHAIWRRVCLVPFEVTIPDQDQDHHLSHKLQSELPGILWWAVDGCQLWQRHGLHPPRAVTDATDQYRSESDPVTMFLEENCMIGGGNKVRSTGLYAAYRSWCVEIGVEALSPESTVTMSRRDGL
jgi:putative DNA primase/helicase